jgi:hypothetical protein
VAPTSASSKRVLIPLHPGKRALSELYESVALWEEGDTAEQGNDLPLHLCDAATPRVLHLVTTGVHLMNRKQPR